MSNFTIYDAAHQYGLDSYWSGASELGTILGPKLREDGTLPNGYSITTTVTYGNGFYVKESFAITSQFGGNLTGVVLYSPKGEMLHAWSGSNPYTAGTRSADRSAGALFAGSDVITGNAFDNILQGGKGDDVFNGGPGLDTAVFQGTLSQYTISQAAGGSLKVSGPDGNDTLNSIERLRFDDFIVSYDTAGTAGQAYRLYQAAFNRTPDKAGLGYQVHVLDAGASLAQVAQGFIDSAEFRATYGSLDNGQFVTQLYANVLHRAPDAGGLAYHIGNLESGAASRTGTLVVFSESAENQAALVGTMAAGMMYAV